MSLPLSGEHLDGYTVRVPIGCGSSAVVYEAMDEREGGLVAIKVLRPEAERSAVARRRFEREITALTRIRSPYVPRVYGHGRVRGLPYVVMDRLRGSTLRDRLRAEVRLPLDSAVQLATELASALAAIHAADVVHRDVKPANLFLHEPEGGGEVLQLLDFGVCRMIGGDSGRVTRPGMTVGTPAYMSPEQARGLPLDARSDVFSAGSVLYEMIAGRAPFLAESPDEAARAVLAANPQPLGAIREGCPIELTRIVERALRKLPEERYESAEALLGALVAYAAGRATRSSVRHRAPPTVPSEAARAEPVSRRVATRSMRLSPPEKSRSKAAGWRFAATFLVVSVGFGAGVIHILGESFREDSRVAPITPPAPTTSVSPTVPEPFPDRLEVLSRARVWPIVPSETEEDPPLPRGEQDQGEQDQGEQDQGEQDQGEQDQEEHPQEAVSRRRRRAVTHHRGGTTGERARRSSRTSSLSSGAGSRRSQARLDAAPPEGGKYSRRRSGHAPELMPLPANPF